jgi:hypothetical protein
MTKGALGKNVYRGDKARGDDWGEVVDDFKIAEQFLPIWGRCGGVPRRRGSGKAVGFEARGKAFPRLIILFFS